MGKHRWSKSRPIALVSAKGAAPLPFVYSEDSAQFKQVYYLERPLLTFFEAQAWNPGFWTNLSLEQGYATHYSPCHTEDCRVRLCVVISRRRGMMRGLFCTWVLVFSTKRSQMWTLISSQLAWRKNPEMVQYQGFLARGNFPSNQWVVMEKQRRRNLDHWFGGKTFTFGLQKVEEFWVQLGEGIGLFQNQELAHFIKKVFWTQISRF